MQLAPSHVRLTGAEIEMVGMISRERRLLSALGPVRDEFDYILVDCPPSLGLLTLNTLTAADSVLIPIQCEYYALEGLGKLLNTVRLVQKHLNPKLQVEGVLLTMYDARLNLSRQVAEEAKSYFGDKVYRTAIARNVKLGEAPSFGKPIILYDIMSSGSQHYMNLAGEVIANG
jgi:chromosome partitioning protein